MQRESICNDYLDILPKKYLRYCLLDAHTGGNNEEDMHKGLAVVTSRLSTLMSQTLRSVRAEEVGDFLMGDPEFWFAAAQGDLMRLRNTLVEGPKNKRPKPKLREEKPKAKEKGTKAPQKKPNKK